MPDEPNTEEKVSDADIDKNIQTLIDELRTERAEKSEAEKKAEAEAAAKAAAEAAAQNAPKRVSIDDLTEMVKAGKTAEAIQAAVGSTEEALQYQQAADNATKMAEVRNDLADDPRYKDEFERYKDQMTDFIRENKIQAAQLTTKSNWLQLLKWVQSNDPEYIERKVDERLQARENPKKRVPSDVSRPGAETVIIDEEAGDVELSDRQAHVFAEMGLGGEEATKRVKARIKQIRDIQKDPVKLRKAAEDGGVEI
jgi:hypothetical protein